MKQGILYNLLQPNTAVAVTGPSIIGNPLTETKAIQAILTGTGAVSATIIIEAANTPDAEAWMPMGTISLSGSTAVTDGFVVEIQWLYTRARLTVITGTNAKITCNLVV